MSSAPPMSHALDSVELTVSGMTCASCAARVQRKLNKIDGVSATVNYATEKATVTAPPTVDVRTLIEQVRNAGYDAAPVEQEPNRAPDADRVRYLWRRLIVALLLGTPAGDLSITLALVPSLRFPGWQWLLLALTLPVVTWCAWPFHRKAAKAAAHGASSMDTLVSLGIIAASCWSLYTIFAVNTTHETGQRGWGLLFQPGGSVYLEVAAGVTCFVLAGRLFEAKAKNTAGGALRALAELGAKDVALLDDDDTERRVPVEQLSVGARFVVRPGDTIATDGVVETGSAAIDTSSMTGESAPVEVGDGERVTGGTIALGGRLVVRAERVGKDTQLAQLVSLVERAQTDKAGVQRLADRISAVFVPAVVALAAGTGVVWWLVGDGAQHAISAALGVLIIACPCALGLATPTALLVASGRGAQLGIFIKGHQALESARAIDTVVFDKTGTLTSGRMTVVDVWLADGVDHATALRYGGAVESASEHAIARAIDSAADDFSVALPQVDDFAAMAGLGARGQVDGSGVLIGSPRLFDQEGIERPAALTAVLADWTRQGRTAVLLAVDGRISGAFALADKVKPSASSAVATLRGWGLRTVLLTGDNDATAATVGAEAGVDEVIADVLPAEKAAVIRRLRASGRAVAMVGDGVNDAPALASADLGLAVVTGTDVALGAADLILVRDDLRVVPAAIGLARATLRTIKLNLGWAFGYNLAAIPIAAAGLLNPLIAAAAMALSSLLVVSNSLRLRSFGQDPR